MTITLNDRVISKKNSKQLFRSGGRTIISTSKAYKLWHTNAIYQLLPWRPKTPLAGPISLSLHFHLKGKIDADLDNLTASICDVLTDAGVIEDDKQIVEMHLYKIAGSPDFRTVIEVRQQA